MRVLAPGVRFIIVSKVSLVVPERNRPVAKHVGRLDDISDMALSGS